ncbi:mechanosensitive ion channel family protein [uncultured Methanobrevibacter sp.]|uniref:mechanosensitive ion channel family protein n=1 Tax=uncultured Methanobrevibacter sp. TaxID=253161 RepID=UPI002618BFFB|nr:mechanosensitive ion channel domain-containing protein [uncultured Methanobrevibacter sp.]
MNILSIFEDPISKIIFILVVIFLTSIIVRLVAYLMNKIKRFKKDITLIYLVRDIINYIIYFIALMEILQIFDINLAGTLLSLGIVGIAVSFAAKDLISNFFSGILLIMGRSVKVGDTLEIKEMKGTVEIIRLRSTTIKDDNGVLSNIPNSTLTNNTYLQYNQKERYRIDLIVGIGLDIDIEDFKNHILNFINKQEGVLKNPKAKIFSKGITFEETTLKISFWIKDFNKKEEYKLIITNEVRKYVNR